jgi:hypothetical protein
MKKTLSRSIMGAMAVILTAQTTPNAGFLMSSAHAQDLNLEGSASTVSKVSEIKAAYSQFKKNVDYGLMSSKQAIELFTTTLIEKNITEADMADFVKAYADSAETYEQYAQSIESAKLSLDGADLTPEEFGMFAGQSLEMFDTEALKWSGCAGLGIGVVLIIGAVTMGIIALVKTEGEDSIRDKFAEKRRRQDRDHQANINYINNAENEIQADINVALADIDQVNEEIDQAQSDLAYWNGVLASALNNDDLEGAQQANNNISIISQNIQEYQQDIVAIQNDIQALVTELDNYQDPDYAQAQLDAENASYAQASINLDNEEEARVDLIPTEKRRARTLGIAAGVSAAIGTYLVIDGSSDC